MTTDNGILQTRLFACHKQTEPVLISACLLGIPCRWHGRRAKIREELIAGLKRKYVLVPVCPEQLGGMPTPRTGEMLHGTGAQVLDEGLRLIAPRRARMSRSFTFAVRSTHWKLPKLSVRNVPISRVAAPRVIGTALPAKFSAGAASR